MRAKAVLAAVVVLVGGYFFFRAFSSSPPSDSLPPNVVVILIDTLRPDYLGIYGHEPETAPFLSQIAEQSSVFKKTAGDAPGKTIAVPLDDELLETLESLGYVE